MIAIESILNGKKAPKKEAVFVQDFNEEEEQNIEVAKKEEEEKKEKEKQKKEKGEEEEEITIILDRDTEDNFNSEIQKKTKKLKEVKSELSEKKELLDPVIKQGGENAVEALVVKGEIDEIEDRIHEVLKDLEPTGGKEKQKKEEKEENIQVQAIAEKKTATNTTSSDMHMILEKLNTIIELGEKILNRLDAVIEKTNETQLQVTQNTKTASMKY